MAQMLASLALFFSRSRGEKMKAQLKITEKEIQDSCRDYLQLKGYYVMRLNSGSFPLGEGKNRRFFRSCEPGTPDLMAFKKHTMYGNSNTLLGLYFIEVKRARSNLTE